jgi:hypothetical protein
MHNMLRRISPRAAVVAALALVTGASGVALAGSPPPVKISGTAVAGVRLTATGVDRTYFNTKGGPPTITHAAGSGVYYIQFPGAGITDGNSILEVTPDTPSVDCTAVNADYALAPTGPVIAVETKDCTNKFADRGFHLVVYR